MTDDQNLWDISSVRFRIGTVRQWRLAPSFGLGKRRIWRNDLQRRAYDESTKFGNRINDPFLRVVENAIIV